MGMIREILTAAGVLFEHVRFKTPPASTYAVYFDDVSGEGADRVGTARSAGLPRIYHHNVRVELYEPTQDDKTETAIEAELDARGVEWTKEDRYWLQSEQRYQVLYEFSYTTKTR